MIEMIEVSTCLDLEFLILDDVLVDLYLFIFVPLYYLPMLCSVNTHLLVMAFEYGVNQESVNFEIC